MRVLSGQQVLARIVFGESDKWQHRPLATALLERLRREGFAGATVFRGMSGFGARSVIHTASLVDLSGDMPIVIELVDTPEHMDRLRPILDEMVSGGCLVTMEKVDVLKYSPGN